MHIITTIRILSFARECDKNGEIYKVRYDAVNAMLLNEFLKEHRKVEGQEATVAQLRKDLQANGTRQQQQIDALTAGLQKVSAQLELRKSAPQTACVPAAQFTRRGGRTPSE